MSTDDRANTTVILIWEVEFFVQDTDKRRNADSEASQCS